MASSSNDEELETSSQYEEEIGTIFSSEEDEPKKKNEEEEVLGSKWRSEVTPMNVNSKRVKKTGEETKRRDYQNRWTEEDEIALLQGIINFKDSIGKSPFEDRYGFIESVKKEISVKANVRTYMDKIRHLKRKYVKKRKIFVKAHDLKCEDLSKFIWGDEVNSDVKSNEKIEKQKKKKKKQDLSSSLNSSKVVKHGGEGNSNVKSNGKSKKQDLFSSPNGKMVKEEEEEEGDVTNTDWFENSFLVGLVESLGVDSVKKKWSLVSIESKKKLEEKLKLLQGKELECKKIEEMLKAREVECVRQRSDLLNEVISVITKSN